MLEQRLDLAVELADGDRGRRRIRLTRFFHAREYNEACKAFAENLIGVELSDSPPDKEPGILMRIAKEALTFDDVLLQPGYSSVLPHEVDLSTQLTREIRLNIPLVSAAMDSVTDSRLAIALAQEGGIGILHKNMPIEQQAY